MITEYDNTISVEDIIYRYFTKYEVLNQLIPYAFSGSRSNHLNIIIDLYGIYRTMYSRHYRTKVVEYTDFTSAIVNMCGHYRAFFRKIRVSTTIYIVSSHNRPQFILDKIPGYNSDFGDKLKNTVVGKMVDLNTGLLKILCPYLPDIHFIETEFESAAVMQEIITLAPEGDPFLIISTDSYPMQLTFLNDNVSYLYPIKTYGNDSSHIICPKWHREHRKSFWFVFSRKLSKSASFDRLSEISASNMMLLASLNQFKERNFSKAILNITKSTDLIYSLVQNDDIMLTPQACMINLMNFNITPEQIQEIQDRYFALNLKTQYMYFSESLEPKQLRFDNLNDPDAVNMINSNYFQNNPLNILQL